MNSHPDEAALYNAFDSAPDAIVAFLQHQVQTVGLTAPVRALDIGCGPGRMLPALAKLGWTAHGVEPDPDYRAFARQRSADVPGTTVSDGSFESLDFDSDFDLALAINSVLNHVLSPVARADALRRSHKAIRPGGLLVLDVANLPWILDHYVEPLPRTAQVHGESVTLNHRHEIDLTAQVFTTHQVFTVGDAPIRTESMKSHRYAIIQQSTLAQEVRAAGFHDARTFSGWNSRTPTLAEGARIIIVAVRASE